MAVDPRVSSSQWIGSIVGTFKVGDGHKVGPPVFQPAKARMTLKGQHVQVNVVAMLKQVNPPKARMTLRKTALSTLALNVSSTAKPSPTAIPKLILKGKPGLRLVTPGRQVTGKPKITLRSKTYRLNRSNTARLGKAKMILRGEALTKVGKAGLVPTVPTTKILVPSGVQDHGSLVPTPAYTDGLLVPTVEEFV
jgi:hypothetical protein